MILIFALFLFIPSFSFAQNALEPTIDDFDKIIFYMNSEYQSSLKDIYEGLAITDDSDMTTQITFVDPDMPNCSFFLRLTLERKMTPNSMDEILHFTNCKGADHALVIRRQGKDLKPASINDLMYLRLPKVAGTTLYTVVFDLLGAKIFYRKSDLIEEAKYEFLFPKFSWWLEYKKVALPEEDSSVSYKGFYKMPGLDLIADTNADLDVLINTHGKATSFTYFKNNEEIRYYDFINYFQTVMLIYRNTSFSLDFNYFLRN